MTKLTFDDEFNSLDAGTAGAGKPWEYSFDYAPNGFSDSSMSSFEVNPNTPGMPADANMYSVNGGILSMGIKNTPSDVPGSLVNNQPFLASQINTKNQFSQTYGYFEVRMQTEAVTGTSVAFWAIPQDGSWPPEVDMPEIEGQWPSWVNWGMHSGPNNTTPQLWDYNAPDTSAGMNVFAVDWEPNTVTFYLNGKVEYQEATPSDWNKPMYLILDALANAPGSWDGSPPSTINTALKVDYVRAYNSNPYANGLTNPDWTNHGTTATTATPTVDASGNLTGFGSGATPPAKASPDNTVVTAAQAAQGASITDASGNVWSIASNGQVSVNGTPDGQSAGVVELAYEKGLIWQENSANMWWSKSKPSDTWGPTYGTAASPVPPPAWQDLSVVVPGTPASVTAGKATAISGISIADPWAATASGTMTLKVSDKTGSITLGGQTFGPAGGTLTGTEAQLNADLAGLTYKGASAGTDTLSLDIKNQGGAEVTKTVAVNVAAAPVVTTHQLALVLSEDAYLGNAQFIAKIDGTQLGAAQSVTALQSASQTQTFTYSGTWSAGQHSIEIDFTNDAYGGPGKDRNLYVDQVKYDGHAAMSQAAPLFGNGAVTVHVGQ